jgi:glutamine synthetase
MRHAIGGVLERAPDLMLWYAPTVNSYRRTRAEEFSGHGRSWGYDSRMVSCRVLVESPASTRLEWRVPGADVNPYLAIAALLASVVDGIDRGADPGEPLVGAGFDREVAPLPGTLGEAVERFRDSAFAAEVLGKDVVAHYAEAGRWEWEQFLGPGAVGEWERRRYFDVI